MVLSDFYEGTTKNFNVTITYNGSNPDITSDTVQLFVKKSKTIKDSDASISSSADVATNGATGVAAFSIVGSDTGISTGSYFYELYWTLGTGEQFVLESSTVNVLDRIKDV